VVLSFGGPAWSIAVAAGLGVASDMEGLAISLMLPRWKNDVKTLAAARQLRREMLG
jgi:hypothetical protein